MFEQSKFWVFIFLAIVLGSLGYGAHYLSSVDEANLALQDSKSKLAGMQEMLVHRQRAWAEKEQFLSKIQVENDKNAVLLKAKDDQELRFNKADSELKYALQSMGTSVDKTRNNAPGTELAEVTLTNGKVLRNVKIRKIEDAGISLIHADGIGTVPLDLLPDNLKEQYDLGPKALVPMIQKAQAGLLLTKSEKNSVNEQPKVPSKTSPSPSSPSPPETKSTVDDSKTKRIKMRMAELDSRITTFTNVLEKYKISATGHQALASGALGRGQPSTLHTQNAQEVLAKATALEVELNSLRAERGKLNVELEYAHRNR